LNYRLQSVLLLAITSVIWGSSFILIKRGLEVFEPLEVATLRVTVGCLVFLPIAIANLKIIRKGDVKFMVLSGLMGSFFPSILFSVAGSGMSSALSGMLNGITPLFTFIISGLFFSYTFHKKQIWGILVGFLGAMILAFSKGNGAIDLNIFALLVVLATVLYAINVNILNQFLNGYKPLALTALCILFAGIPAMCILFGQTGFVQKMITHPQAIKAFGFVFLLGLMGTSVAMVLFNRLIQISGPVTASTVTYLMPVIALFWGFMDNESLNLFHFSGLAAILGGVFLVNQKK
jgi:drug/metabolite transporter (DMT)-like permease